MKLKAGPPSDLAAVSPNKTRLEWGWRFLAAGLLVAIIILLSFPNRSIVQTPESIPDREGNLLFSGVENHPSGYKFAWAVIESALLYPDAPRYSPLILNLRLNLDRPPSAAPAIIEIYERPAQATEDEPEGKVEGKEQVVTTLLYDPTRTGPQDYEVRLPPRDKGDGVYLSFKSNTFQVAGDRRQLAFMFLRAELKMPRSHLRYLFWPHYYFPVAFLFLAGTIAWTRVVGLGWVATLGLNGMLAYALMMAVQSTWRITWLMLLITLGLWGCYFWQSWARITNQTAILAMFTACAGVISLFLLTNDNLKGDTVYYLNWSRSIHTFGIWDIYSHDASLNYLPLVVYLLWFYNLVVYTFGWQDNILAWRVFASLLYLGLLFVLYLIARGRGSGGERTAEQAMPETSSSDPQPPLTSPTRHYWLILVGFNVSLFYNPTIWGQSDIIAALPLALAFYLITRGQGSGVGGQGAGIGENAGQGQSQFSIFDFRFSIKRLSLQSSVLSGLALGLVAISKPQAWFVLPLAIILLLKVAGWRRGLIGLAAGAGTALTVSVIAFGFNVEAFNRYWGQGQLTGDYRYDFPAAYNLNYLVLGLRTEVPTVLTLFGFGIVGLAGLLVVWGIIHGASGWGKVGLAAALLNTACFTFLIKMKERYLMYAMPLFGLATHYNRRLIGPYLTLGWLQLINLSIIMFQSGRSRLQTLPENFYWWSSLLSQEWLRRGVAIGFILTLGWMAVLYWREANSSKTEDWTAAV